MLRYTQQALVDEVGSNGLARFADASVLVIGAGGLGTPTAVYLAAAGIGRLGIADGDTIEASNLGRQFLYSEGEIGLGKAAVLTQRLREQNPAIRVDTFASSVDAANAAELFAAYDIICDCTDNAAARTLCDQVCLELNKPLVYAVVRDWQGYVTVLHHQNAVSLDHIFSHGDLLEAEGGNCAYAGIMNATCGIAGSLQAAEVFKILLGLPSELDGGILAFNALLSVFRMFKLQTIERPSM